VVFHDTQASFVLQVEAVAVVSEVQYVHVEVATLLSSLHLGNHDQLS